MAMQPVTQGFEPPPQFGEWLSGTNKQIVHPTFMPEPFTVEEILAFENYVQSLEFIAERLDFVVEFARYAGLDDDGAYRFDEWTENYGPVGALDEFAKLGFPFLDRHANIIRETVKGWKRQARAGETEPALLPELARRVAQLNSRIKELKWQFTKREDNELVARLLIRVGNHRPLSPAEKIRLSDAIRRRVQVRSTPSERRSDWYGDDGR